MNRRLSPTRRYLPPRSYRSASERRDHLLATGLVLVLQAAIAASLAVSAAQTYRLWRQGVAYLPEEIARIVPAVLGLGGMVAAVAALRSLRRLDAIRRTPVDDARAWPS